jgi:hypothetical protein
LGPRTRQDPACGVFPKAGKITTTAVRFRCFQAENRAVGPSTAWQVRCTIGSIMQSQILDYDIPAHEFETGAHSGPLGTLDDFALDPGCTRGVAIDALEPGTRVVVGTSHSCYRFVINDPARRRGTVTGGKLFTEPTDVRIDGATAGGTVIKAGWIGVGLRMELTVGSKRVITSCVKFLAVEKLPSAA